METLKQKLIDLFLDASNSQSKFRRKLYEDAFKTYYEKHKEVFDEIIKMCEEAEDEDSVIEELAAIIPEYAHEKLNQIRGKRKRDSEILNYNLDMITYVFPAIAYGKNEHCIKLADKILEKWNQPPIETKIQWTTYEKLKGGFKTRLCYITTAVCESQNKADDCYELKLLRDYRDSYLMNSEEGKAVVEEYYDIAPTIVSRINNKDNSKKIYEEIYDKYISDCIHLLEEDKKEECQEVYTGMVEELRKEYLYS